MPRVTPAAPASVCLVRLSALGDVVMVLPLVRWLRRCWPEARLTWVCGRAVLPVLAPLVDEGVELVAIDKPRGPRDYLRFRRAMAGRRFDVVLALQASWRANWLYACLRAPRKIGYGRDRAKDLHGWFVNEALPPAKPHLVDGFLQFGEALGLGWPEAIEWGLPVDAAAAECVASLVPAGPFLALNACSSKPERDWSPANYARVIAEAARIHGITTVLIGSPAQREVAVAAEVERLAGVPVTNLVGRTKLTEMVAVLARCSALLSPDTGAVHLANALGKPVVGLYAVAPSARTGPYGHNAFCVDRFDEAVRRFLGRDPATTPWAQRVHHPAAMALVQVEDVLAALSRALAGEPPRSR
ncbi:glycosyltransferase family 9 protein [Nibricoccus sp. IMCC34717]|uniref:glycosyltransferase family 9 protein n=1 Tax=Nibricoccus sp. IMCC34717 TaxID=3034021 RepID=UPI00384A84FD